MTVHDTDVEVPGSPSFTMRIDSFVDFPKSTASDELLLQATMTNGAKSSSDYGDSQIEKPIEYFREESKGRDGLVSPTHVPSFNNLSADKPNKIVPSLDLHGVKACKEDTLVTTENCDFEVNVDTQRSWRELIKDNPFTAN